MAGALSKRIEPGLWARKAGDDWDWIFRTDSNVDSYTDPVVEIRVGSTRDSALVASSQVITDVPLIVTTGDPAISLPATDFGNGIFTFVLYADDTVELAPDLVPVHYYIEAEALVGGARKTILPTQEIWALPQLSVRSS